MTQLYELSRPWPDHLVKQKPNKKGFEAKYVEHGNITQRLLQVLGPFSTHVHQVVRDPNDNLVGVLLTLETTVDGVPVSVTEVGDVENSDEKTDGAALKDAMSDAIKRCAMRLGCGLHLWCGESYFLDQKLAPKQEGEQDD